MTKPTYTELRDALSIAIGVIELMQHESIDKTTVAERLARIKQAYAAASSRKR